jgi:hypothetical protein
MKSKQKLSGNLWYLVLQWWLLQHRLSNDPISHLCSISKSYKFGSQNLLAIMFGASFWNVVHFIRTLHFIGSVFVPLFPLPWCANMDADIFQALLFLWSEVYTQKSPIVYWSIFICMFFPIWTGIWLVLICDMLLHLCFLKLSVFKCDVSLAKWIKLLMVLYSQHSLRS